MNVYITGKNWLAREKAGMNGWLFSFLLFTIFCCYTAVV